MSSDTEKKPPSRRRPRRLVRQLPETASWDDLMYEILVRQKIEAGLPICGTVANMIMRAIRREFGMA